MRIADFAVYGWLPTEDEDDIEEMKDLGSFPVDTWEQLGTFIAKDQKGLQSFPLEKRAWIKYLGIKVFTHHNTGTVCTVNGISAFGFTPEQALHSALDDDDYKGPPPNINKTNLTLNENHNNITLSKNEIKEEEEEDLNNNIVHSMTNGINTGGNVANVNLEKVLENGEKEMVVGKEPPTILTFKKLNRDVKEMQQSNMVLTKYVDELHLGLNKTLDEIEIQLKKLNGKNNILNQTLEKVNLNI